jgi:hypothetical protein
MSDTQELVRIAIEASNRLSSEFREGRSKIVQRLDAAKKELETYQTSRFVTHAAVEHAIMFMVDFIKLLLMKDHIVVVLDMPKRTTYKTILMKEINKIDKAVTLEQIAENAAVNSLISHLELHCRPIRCKGRLRIQSFFGSDYSGAEIADFHVCWDNLNDIVFTADGKKIPNDNVTIKYAAEDMLEYANRIGPGLENEFYSEKDIERTGFYSFLDYDFDFIGYRWD